MHYAQAQSQMPLQGNNGIAPASTTGSDSRSFLRTTESHPLPFQNGPMQRQGSQLTLPSPPASEPSTSASGEIIKPRAIGHTGSNSSGWAYSDAVKKYDYTEGYHCLMAYLHDRCVVHVQLTIHLTDHWTQFFRAGVDACCCGVV